MNYYINIESGIMELFIPKGNEEFLWYIKEKKWKRENNWHRDIIEFTYKYELPFTLPLKSKYTDEELNSLIPIEVYL